MTSIYVVVTGARGSTPRDVGTAMHVTPNGVVGTIGGGALEYHAIAEARRLVSENVSEMERTYPLGPDLGQCCGGAMTLRYTSDPHAVDSPRVQRPLAGVLGGAADELWLWGAGHVGRAVIDTMPPLAFQVTWVDTDRTRFPPQIPGHVTPVPAADLPVLAARSPITAKHLIFTYSHDIDFDLCAALLRRRASWIGLIGSETKKTRFFKRLRAMDLDPGNITCPIGDTSLGKVPHAIANGVVAQLLSLRTASGE